MKKGLKITLKIFGILIVVIIAAVILIPVLFKGKILEIAQEQANNNLNAVVKFSDLDLSIIKNFPDLSVELKELSVVGVDTFKTDTLMYFDSFNVGLNIMSVISGDEIKIRKVSLINPKIKAIVLHDGRANWDIMKPDTVKTLEDTASEPAKFKVKLKKLNIENANIVYDDKSSDMYSEIKNFNFDLKGDMTQDFTNLNIEMLIEAITFNMEGVNYLKKAKVGFKSDIEADLKNSKYTFKDNEFSLNDLKLLFAGTVAMPDTNIVTDVTFKAGKTEFKSVLSLIPAIYMKDFETIKTSGSFAFSGYAKGTYNAVNMPAFGIDLTVSNANFRYPDLPKSVDNINIAVKVDAKEGTGEYMTVDLKNAHIEMAGNPFDAKMFLNMTPADINMKGNVKGTIVLESLKDVVPLEDMDITGKIISDITFAGNMSDIEAEKYENFNAAGNVKLENFNLKTSGVPPVNISSSSMDFTPQNLKLNNFDCTVGRSDFHLNGTIDNILSYVFKEQLLKGTFNFSSDFLDVNEFMTSTESESTSGQAANQTTETETASSEPIEIPANIDFVLNSNIKKILYYKIEITNTIGTITLKESKLTMDKLAMSLLQGTMQMSGSFDAKVPVKPKADFEMSISNFDIKQMYESVTTIQEMATFAENCVGKISIDLKFNSDLDVELMPVYETFNGSGGLKSQNIGVSNNKVFNKLAELTKSDKYKNPVLKNINMFFKIENGKITIEPTTLSAADNKFTFGGTQSLDKKIDFDIAMELPSNLVANVLGQLPVGKVPEKLEITAKIGNTVDDPKITNFKSNYTEGLKEEVKEKVEEVKEDLKAKAKEIMDKAQKEADQVIALATQQAQKIQDEARKMGDLAMSEPKNQANTLIKKADNIVAKKAAEKASEKLLAEAQKKVDLINKEAKTKSDNIINTAKQKSNQIMEKARKDAEKV